MAGEGFRRALAEERVIVAGEAAVVGARARRIRTREPFDGTMDRRAAGRKFIDETSRSLTK